MSPVQSLSSTPQPYTRIPMKPHIAGADFAHVVLLGAILGILIVGLGFIVHNRRSH